MFKYDNKLKCQCCGELTNAITEVCTDGGYVSECITECETCGYEDYWAYGYYERNPHSLKRVGIFTGIFYLVIIVTIIAMTCSKSNAHTFETTFYLKTKHVRDTYWDKGVEHQLNESHDFIGIEYRTDNMGYGIARFKNSYNRTSVMIDTVYYKSLSDNVEIGLRAGVVTGYEDYDYCIVNGATLCPIVSASIAYTKYDTIIPKFIILPTAVAISFSTRF